MKYRIAPGLPLSHDVDTSTLPPNRGHIHVAIHLASSPDFHLLFHPCPKSTWFIRLLDGVCGGEIDNVTHALPRRKLHPSPRETRRARPPGTSIPSSHHPIAYLLSYCPRRYSHHWTQLSRASAPRLYNSLFPSRIGHAVGVKRLRCGLFFFLYTLRGALCVFSSLGYSYYRR